MHLAICEDLQAELSKFKSVAEPVRAAARKALAQAKPKGKAKAKGSAAKK